MVSSTHGRARPFRVLLATVTALFVVGMTSPTYAASDMGEANQSEAAAEPDETGPETKEPNSRAMGAPGQEKKQAPQQDPGSPDAGGPDHSSGNASTEGDPTQPQPQSNADNGDGGANAGDCDSGAGHSYCSTRDGSPSMNGNGGGEAKGKPCAGCVGKADNKFPKGQQPDGSDHNQGYECDGNQGVAKTNPAHTGCASPTEEPPTEEPPPEECVPTEENDFCEEPEGEEPPPEECVPTEENDFCEDEVLPDEDEVCPEGEEMVDGKCDEIAGVTGERPRPPALVPTGLLPNTGAGAWSPFLALGGVALTVAGVGLMRGRRRLRPE